MVCFLGLAACSDQRLDPVFLAYNLSFCVLYGGLLLAEKHPKKVQIEEEDGPTVQIIPPHGQRDTTQPPDCPGVAWRHGAGTGRIRGGLWDPLWRDGHLQLSPWQRGCCTGRGIYEAAGSRFSLLPGRVHPHQTLNDDALNGYNGITMFSSSVNVSVTKFMATLGYGAKPTYNRYSFEEASPVAALFLNLKYMISRNGRSWIVICSSRSTTWKCHTPGKYCPTFPSIKTENLS